MKKLSISGGGFYDKEGDESKIGRWIELYDEPWVQSLLIQEGGYKKGFKTGRWDILFKNDKNKLYKM